MVVGLLFVAGTAFGSARADDEVVASPLDRLKNRSAAARWQDLRQRLQHESPARTASSSADESHSVGESRPADRFESVPEPRALAPLRSPSPETTSRSETTRSETTLRPRVESSAEHTDVRATRPDAATSSQSITDSQSIIEPSFGSDWPSPAQRPVPLSLPVTEQGLDRSPPLSRPLSTETSHLPPPRISARRLDDDAADSRASEGELLPLPGLPQASESGRESLDYRATSNELKRVTDILPYSDYEPDPLVAVEDPCRNLCPRPDGVACKPLANGRLPECPQELPIEGEPYAAPLMPPTCFAWQAPNLFHNPLYFEDAQLERYGHTHHDVIQPFVSVGKFGAQLLGLPYQMSIDPMWKRRYTLGWYRPGDCVPHLHYQIPLNAKAAATQAGVTTGAFFLFP